ncbi:MAG: hypothetical protein ABIR60_08525 [Allosphingosinicella sp.]
MSPRSDPVDVDQHTHVFEGATIRRDIVSRHLIERFGDRWWFQTCETCALCRIAPASNEFRNVSPEVPRDWERWRERPDEFEITQMR